jgi:uncharacterized membrane protein
MTKASKNKQQKKDSSILMPEGQSAPLNRQIITEQFSFQGPIPHPSVLDGYEKVMAGTAERIISLAESETKHRHKMEEDILSAEVLGHKCEAREVLIGQIFGFIITLSTIFGGVYAAVNDAQWTGAIIGASGVTGLASVFIMGRKNPKSGKQPNKE